MSSAIVSLENVGVRRRGRVILNGVTLVCERGTITSIRGPNGCGKSTLLGVASGLMEPSWGKVVNRSTTTAYLPERFVPPSGMDASTYLHWVAGTRDIPRRAREDAISASLNSLSFVGTLGPMRFLSKGNLQRVGIASALLGWPELIVLDEPFTGMDRAGTESLARALDRVRAAGSAILVVHHGSAAFSASQTFRLEDGKLHHNPPDDVAPGAYIIRSWARGYAQPTFPDGTTVTLQSAGRYVIASDSNAVASTLTAILDAGWTVDGVERR